MSDFKIELEYVHCDDCDATYLKGVNGKEIAGKGSGGTMPDELGGDPYLAIGGGELDDSPTTKEEYPCPKCGKMLEVKIGKEVETK